MQAALLLRKAHQRPRPPRREKVRAQEHPEPAAAQPDSGTTAPPSLSTRYFPAREAVVEDCPWRVVRTLRYECREQCSGCNQGHCGRAGDGSLKPHPHSCRNCYGLLRRQRIMKEWQEWERHERPYASRAGDDDAGYPEEPAPHSEGVPPPEDNPFASQSQDPQPGPPPPPVAAPWDRRPYTPSQHQPDDASHKRRRRFRIPGALPPGTATSGGGVNGEATRCHRAACPSGERGGPLAPPPLRTLCVLPEFSRSAHALRVQKQRLRVLFLLLAHRMSI